MARLRSDVVRTMTVRGLHSGVVAFAVLSMLGGGAQADWLVKDTDAITELKHANRRLDEISDVLGERIEGDARGTVNDHLRELNDRMALGGSESPGERPPDPQGWSAMQWSEWTTLDEELRRCSQVAGSQKAACESIARTQDSYHKFLRTMYATTQTRHERLQALVAARKKLGPRDYGRLEDLSNQILALQSLIALDRQQAEMVAYSYGARMAFLNRSLAREGTDLIRGAQSGLVAAIVGAGALAVALESIGKN